MPAPDIRDLKRLSRVLSMTAMALRYNLAEILGDEAAVYVNPDPSVSETERHRCWKHSCPCPTGCQKRSSRSRARLRHGLLGREDAGDYLCEHAGDLQPLAVGSSFAFVGKQYKLVAAVGPEPLMQALVFRSRDELVVAFPPYDVRAYRGSLQTRYFFECDRQRAPIGGGLTLVHGMSQVWNHVKESLVVGLRPHAQADLDLTVGGFSFGGGLARLLAFELHAGGGLPYQQLRLSVAGEVRTGDDAWRQWWTNNRTEVAWTAVAIGQETAGRLQLDPIVVTPHVATDGRLAFAHSLSWIFPPEEDQKGWDGDAEVAAVPDERFDRCASMRDSLGHESFLPELLRDPMYPLLRDAAGSMDPAVVKRLHNWHRLDFYSRRVASELEKLRAAKQPAK